MHTLRGLTLRSPALHFLLLGAALRLLEVGFGVDDGEELARTLHVDPARIEQLRGQWRAETGRLPGPAQEQALVRRWVSEEILYREALELGLDRGNSGVCNRLALNMRFFAPDADGSPAELCREAFELGLDRHDPVIRRQLSTLMKIVMRRGLPPELPAREEAEAWIADHAERYSEPARVRLSQVFLSRDRRPETVAEDARALLARLASGGAPPQAPELGDPLPSGKLPATASHRDVARRLGERFADQVFELPAGRWSGPVPSVYGLHLVWVHEQRPGQLRPFEDIAAEAVHDLMAERDEQRLASALAGLRESWDVRIPERKVTS